MEKSQPMFHVIKDPVHGTMQFTAIEDNWVKPFIDTPNFQRLRHIKQLGLGDFIFPGAMHSRFNHCLGCCYIGSQIAQKIGLAHEERQLVMIACLLHDIGHGPFSHAFEDIFQDKFIRHENWTPYFLAEYSSKKFFDAYSQLNPRYPLTEEKFDRISQMITHQHKAKNVLSDIVSSQLDADRLDYLLRDNHFCGVRYGDFDFPWMLHCMAIVNSEEGERLGITYKGIGVAEHYLMARRLMLRNIYHSPKKLAFEKLLVQMLSLLAKTIGEESLFTPIRATRLGQFLLAVNQFNQKYRQSLSPEKEKDQFLKYNYAHYKDLCDYDVFALIKQLAEIENGHAITEIAQRLQERAMPKIIYVDNENLTHAENELREFKLTHHQVFQDWQLTLIQTPQRSYSGEEDPILVMDEHRKVQALGKFSYTINAISDRLEHITFLSIDKPIAKDKRIVQFIQTLQTQTFAKHSMLSPLTK